MKRRWTNQDIKFLKLNYKQFSAEQCAKHLHRTTHSVKQKAGRLGLASERRAFTQEEIEYIKANYHEKGPRALAKEMERKWSSIYTLARRVLDINMDRKAFGRIITQVHTGLKRSQDTKDKMSAHAKKRVGSKNPNWKGGVTTLDQIVYRLLYPVWKYPILCRDGFVCQECGESKHLEVHHIRKYTDIRDEVMRDNPCLFLNNYEDKQKLAKLIVIEHKIEEGITLCYDCHKKCHFEKSGELQGTPQNEGNLQPSSRNVIPFVREKVQRLIGEDTQTNKPDTSARIAIP